jgi:MYXO-CTERM domain-containing protein
MRLRTKAAGAAIGTVMLFSGVSAIPAGAQEVTQAVEEEDDSFDDWGLLGLLGLVGLAGLAGLKRRDDDRYRDPSNRPGPTR